MLKLIKVDPIRGEWVTLLKIPGRMELPMHHHAGTVMVWMPQLQLLEAAQLPARLKASATTAAPKGWLLARLSVARADTRGFGMLGSSIFLCNPPHSLAENLRRELPWLAETLAQEGVEATWSVETGGDHG